MHLSGKLPLKQGIPTKVVVDNHFDRSGVKALRDAQLTDTNNLIDFIHFEELSSNSVRICDRVAKYLFLIYNKPQLAGRNVLVASRMGTTRSLSELGRETVSLQWYFGLSRGRVGTRQHFPACLYTPFLIYILTIYHLIPPSQGALS